MISFILVNSWFQKVMSLILFCLALLGDLSLNSLYSGIPSPKIASYGFLTFFAEMHWLFSLISFQIVPFVLKSDQQGIKCLPVNCELSHPGSIFDFSLLFFSLWISDYTIPMFLIIHPSGLFHCAIRPSEDTLSISIVVFVNFTFILAFDSFYMHCTFAIFQFPIPDGTKILKKVSWIVRQNICFLLT